MGGSDMMEPAALGKCTIFGPYTFNFKQTVQVLLAGNGAIEVQNKEQLFEQIEKCLVDRDLAQTTAANGQEVIRQNQGATQKSVAAIVNILNA